MNPRPLDPQSDIGRISLFRNGSQCGLTSRNRLKPSPADSVHSHPLVTMLLQRRRQAGPLPEFRHRLLELADLVSHESVPASHAGRISPRCLLMLLAACTSVRPLIVPIPVR
jgi:hypothetical protein